MASGHYTQFTDEDGTIQSYCVCPPAPSFKDDESQLLLEALNNWDASHPDAFCRPWAEEEEEEVEEEEEADDDDDDNDVDMPDAQDHEEDDALPWWANDAGTAEAEEKDEEEEDNEEEDDEEDDDEEEDEEEKDEAEAEDQARSAPPGRLDWDDIITEQTEIGEARLAEQAEHRKAATRAADRRCKEKKRREKELAAQADGQPEGSSGPSAVASSSSNTTSGEGRKRKKSQP